MRWSWWTIWTVCFYTGVWSEVWSGGLLGQVCVQFSIFSSHIFVFQCSVIITCTQQLCFCLQRGNVLFLLLIKSLNPEWIESTQTVTWEKALHWKCMCSLWMCVSMPLFLLISSREGYLEIFKSEGFALLGCLAGRMSIFNFTIF